ncbi:hypothetical protein [[Clostridium] aminophilum]|uniref:type II secretion system protein n=1 Tax=[Clostridium] aminophilum TaxID=1526 RepID=UPI0033345D41
MQKRKNRNRWKMGYSLAELLVVVAILIILAGAGGFAFIQHQRKVRLFGLNNSAKEIFLAAQNHLAVAKASGKWKQLVARDKALEEDGGERLSKAMAEPSDFPDDIAWNDDSFRYLTSDDLSYRSSTVARDYTKAILPAFAVDSTIRGNSFVIEYDEETAVVYGVWYTDVMMPDKKHWKRFSDIEDPSSAAYAGLNESRKDENRDKRYQYERETGGALIGYYGGAAAEYSEGNAEILKTLAVTVDNEDALVVNIVNPNRSETKMTIRGETSGNEVSRTIHSSEFDAGNLARVTLDNLIISDDPERPTEKHFADLFPEMIPGENLIITVTVTDAGGREESATVETNSLFASIDEAGDASNPAKVAYVRTARHLQNLSVLFSGVNSTSRDRILITDASLQDSFNWNESGHAPALRSIENDDLKLFDGNFYTIKNLEIASDVTGKVGMFAEPPALTDDLGNPVPVEILQLTLDHVTVDAPGNASDIGVLVGSVPANGQALIRDCKIDTVHFPAAANVKNIGGFVGSVSAHASLTMKDCTLLASADPETAAPAAPIRIRTEAGAAGGIIGVIDPHAAATSLEGVSIDVRQMEINAKGRDSFAGGVIGDGWGESLSLKSVAAAASEGFSIVSTVESAGGLAGRIRAKDVTVESSSFLARTEEGCSTDAVYPDMINGARAAGGLIGDCSTDSGTAPKLVMTESFASCYVKSGGTLLGSASAAAFEQAAGGLVGSMKVSAGSLIDKCYYGGRTQNGTFRTNVPYTAGSAADYVQGRWNICVKTSSAHPNVKTLAAGGLIGYLKGPAAIRHSYSTGSVYREKNVTENGSGGLVGIIADGSGAFAVETCYSTGLVYTSDGLTAVGGFAGAQPGTGTFTGDFFLQGVNYNQTLDGAGAGAISGVTKAATGDGSAFFAAARAEAKWKDKPYDVTLKDAGGNALFPYKTVDQLDGGDTRNEVKYHTGDWTVPEPISVTPSEITGDFGLLYYEWIEGDPNIYFEGYTCERKDPTAGYTLGNMVYHYVSSAGNDESLRGSVFVTEHGKYIKQDGYLLVEKNDLTDLNLASLKVGYAGRNEFNNGPTNGYWMQESHLLTDAFVEYKEMESLLSLSGYKVYAYRYTPNYTYQAGQDGTVMEFGNDPNHPFAVFEFLPFFAGEVKGPDETGIYMEKAGTPNGDGTYYHRIRSAHQLNMLAQLDGVKISGSYLTVAGGGHTTVKQDLDITFDPAKVSFTMCGSGGTTVPADESIAMPKNGDGSYENRSFLSIANGAVFEADKGPDNNYYTLDHLSKPLFAGAVQGTIQNLHITNAAFPYLAEVMYETGVIRGVHITDSSFTSILSTSMQGRIEDLHIANSTGSYLVNTIYYGGAIDGLHISNSNISNLVGTSQGTVRDIHITGSTLAQLIQSNPGVLTVIRIANSTLDYLVKTINYGGTVSDYQFTDTTFQHGLYETNLGQMIENP